MCSGVQASLFCDDLAPFRRGFCQGIQHCAFRNTHSTTQYLDDTRKWPGLKAFVHVISTREMGGKSSRCERVCLMSKRPQAREAATIIQGHWAIENSLHWSLDIIMNDDRYRARKDNAPINFAALRRIALNIIKANQDKGSNRVKFKRAG